MTRYAITRLMLSSSGPHTAARGLGRCGHLTGHAGRPAVHHQVALADPEVLLHGDAHVPGLTRHGLARLDHVALVIDDGQLRRPAVRSGELVAGGDVGADAAALQGSGLGNADHGFSSSTTASRMQASRRAAWSRSRAASSLPE